MVFNDFVHMYHMYQYCMCALLIIQELKYIIKIIEI
jgi:hypothetical protein